MSGETLYQQQPRKHNVAKIRVHDYLYDSAFLVSGARDYARMSFKAAMASAQVVIQPVYRSMFSELRKCPSKKLSYHLNCRLPQHMDRSYEAYLQKVSLTKSTPVPDLTGRDRFKYSIYPRKLLSVKEATPDFHPPTPLVVPTGPNKPRNRGTQSVYRESSAQTTPWQPDGKPAEECEQTPEVLHLDKLEWGPGTPYRLGDLPADFHTTEIINKMRHARTWTEIAERGDCPRWMKNRDAIIEDVETKDWIFREAEIDELQEIRLELLHRMQAELRQKKTNKTSKRLSKLWEQKKQDMERKIQNIRDNMNREIRKLSSMHGGGGALGQVGRMRAARGGGSMMAAARDPASELHAPFIRHGYQARRRHADITYDPGLLSLEDHREIAKPPPWLDSCGQNLKRTCSGHHLPRDNTTLCERETKWSERFLENLHNELIKARLGAAGAGLGRLHVVKPRFVPATPRPDTPVVQAVPDQDEATHQAALVLQRIIRGRAVQCLMYEGRRRAAELTEEMKITHGLQKEDRLRIAKEESKAREYIAAKTEAELKDNAIHALVDELCGGAVSAALDFLEKELKRLKEERRQHAFILVALREKLMREAAEAGRRQKEERRRREHDEMFRQILGVTQETVDVYFQEILAEGVELAAEQEAVRVARKKADKIDVPQNLSTAEENEAVAELVWQCIVDGAPRMAARQRVKSAQQARAHAVRAQLFGVLDDTEANIRECTQCGAPLGELCRCPKCPISQEPTETTSRDDPRWHKTRQRPEKPKKDIGERFPPSYDFRCMLNQLIDEVVVSARARKYEKETVTRDVSIDLYEKTKVTLDVKDMLDAVVDYATNARILPIKKADTHYTMTRIIEGALERTEPPRKPPCPKELPSALRLRAEEIAALADNTCKCVEPSEPIPTMTEEIKRNLLPSEVRILEDMRRCKCDYSPPRHPSTADLETIMETDDNDTAFLTGSTGTRTTGEMGHTTPVTPYDDDQDSSDGGQNKINFIED